jgi:hypothetical protein
LNPQRYSNCALGPRPAQVTSSMPSGDSTHINFNARATLRKWPSKNNERDKGVMHPHPYLVIDGTLDECIKKFLELPVNQRHLYEIHTAPQGGLVGAVMFAEHVVEIARLRDFL